MLQQHNENKNNNNNSNSNSRSNSNFNSNNNNIKMKAMIANISEYPYLSGGKNTMGVIFQKWDSYLKLVSYFFQLLQMLLNFFFQMLLNFKKSFKVQWSQRGKIIFQIWEKYFFYVMWLLILWLVQRSWFQISS